MSDDREIRPGWLPPKAGEPSAPGPAAPARWAPPGQSPSPAPPRFVKAGPRADAGPSSPFAVSAIVTATLSLVLNVLTVGVGWGVCSLLSIAALAAALTARGRLQAGQPGRPGQVRSAFILAVVSLVLAAVAAAIWLGLQSNGITPQDLQDWLERELERRQSDPAGPGRRNTVEALLRP